MYYIAITRIVIAATVSIAAATLVSTTHAQPCVLDETELLLASDGAAYDQLGHSVAISGDAAVIGTDDYDYLGHGTSSAYVFRFDGSGWTEQTELIPADWEADDEFGYTVAISGDVAVVGAHLDNDNGAGSGSAYVFRFDGAQWVEEAKLIASDGAAGEKFGISVAVSGDVAVIGAREHPSYNYGAAYVFRYDGSQWVEEVKLLAFEGGFPGNLFGYSVAVFGDTVVVGATAAYAGSYSQGSAYVFKYDGSQWVEETQLQASDGVWDDEDEFGNSVAIDGNTAVIGAHNDDDSGFFSGSAYVFRYDGANWIEQDKLVPSDGAAQDRFGESVSISGDTALIGAYYDDGSEPYSGSAYVFGFDGAQWVEHAKLAPSDGVAGDYFGVSVALSGDIALGGAMDNDDQGYNSGSAYVFTVLEPCTADLDCDFDTDLTDLGILLGAYGSCIGDPNYTADADLTADGCVSLADLSVLLGDYGCGA